jgi:hypothetical protein
LPAAAFLEFEDIRDADDAVRKLDGYRGWVSDGCLPTDRKNRLHKYGGELAM